MTDHANLVYINKSVNMMVQRWKTAIGSYDFVIEHISGVKNIVADYLSRLVKNLLIEEVRKDQELTEEKKDELILLMLHHETKSLMRHMSKSKVYITTSSVTVG